NITAGIWLTSRQILAQLQQLAPSAQVNEEATAGTQSHDVAASRGPLSGHRLFNDLHWTPSYDLRAGLAEYLQWRRDADFLD
ncbi:MAG: hypothetical protein J4N81_15275, partial [Chloroflexi bacterium]|nr:hypothetical protein [Chloroflexota bacterium]